MAGACLCLIDMAERSMRAVQYSGYGGGAAALRHVETKIPSPGKGEVLLKVEAAAINPLDWRIQRGLVRPFLPPKFPFVPGIEVAGEISEVGAGVEGFNTGDRVVAWLTVPKSGGLAEYATAQAHVTFQLPPQVTAVQAAGLPIAAMTALQALKHITTKFDGSGEPANVLITAASGGVGTYAVQLAKFANLHVTATCGARNADLVRSLGADQVLDYRTPEGRSLICPSGRQYDLVVHSAAGVAWSTFARNLSARGKVVHLTPGMGTYALWALHKLVLPWKKYFVPMLLVPTREDLELLVELLAEGKIRAVIDSTYGFGKTKEAWAKAMEGHASGKIIVEI